ncbi:MAG: DUF1549 domain-containing protein, partial [Acidobacteria bacterium]|nr:DUF1549 domain-containing protein [Acidobacteriota bacterium]
MVRTGIILLALAANAPAADATFEQKVRPLLAAHCAECHAEKVKTSGFSVLNAETLIAGGNKHGRAVVGGDPAASPLVKMLKGELTPRMPFGKALPDADIAAIEGWIRALAPAKAADQAGSWAFQAPVKHDPPAVRRAGWVRNPIDAFSLRKLEERGLEPAPPAHKRTLARRAYFDLVGMPPSPDELQAFLDDTSSGAYARLLDKLLDDPRYGERWGRYWLDLARYGETSGLEGDGAIGNAWRYRDWVINAFNRDMPYDQFVLKQLAGGDEHSQTRNNYQPDIQGHVPVAFLRLAPWDRSNLVADEVRQNYLSEVTATTASVFMGLTLGCARCHDHKYDPIPTRDFYRMQAFFNAIRVEDVEVPHKDQAMAERAAARIKASEEALKSGPDARELAEMEKALLPRLVEKRAAEARNRELTTEDLRLELRWKGQTTYTPPEVERHRELREAADRTQDLEEKRALDAFEKDLLKRLRPSDDRYQALGIEDLRAELGREKPRYFTEADKERHRELMGKKSLLERRIARLRPRVLSITNVPGPPAGPGLPLTHVLRSGDYRQPGEVVEPGFLSSITGNSQPAAIESDRYRQFPTRGLRITLAKWIARADHPLTARVMVNRIWQQHFGRGIVETPSDFGRNGARPTHPELLDWLALKFIEEKWSVKAMHRLMMTSATYLQAAENPAVRDPAADPANRLLWRYSRRRLDAEAIRDSILYLSGRLNPERGGPSVFPPLPADLADFARYGRT